MMAQGISIAIADHHPLYRTQCVRLLDQHVVGARVVQFDSVSSLVNEGASSRKPNLALIGSNLPDAEVEFLTKSFREFAAETIVCVVSDSADVEMVRLAKRFGAKGLISKSLEARDWLAVIATLLRGGTWFPAPSPSQPTRQTTSLSTGASKTLTPAQTRVLGCLHRGLKNRQIAEELGVAPTTATHHVSLVMKKLGVKSRTQAVVVSAKSNLSAYSGNSRC